MGNYHPEEYWSDLARRTSAQKYGVVAGDVEPFYEYKRAKFLELFRNIDFQNKKVLEVGCGPGANLIEIMKLNPAELKAVDISHEMISEAKRNTKEKVEIIKTNGVEIDFLDQYFDVVFTVTVLQHNTDEPMLEKLIDSICRVSGSDVYLFERIEHRIKGNELNMGRPISYYSNLMDKHGFNIQSVDFLNIDVSYIMAGLSRKLFNSTNRKEGDPLSSISLQIQKTCLPFTKRMDPLVRWNRELAMLKFSKTNTN